MWYIIWKSLTVLGIWEQYWRTNNVNDVIKKKCMLLFSSNVILSAFQNTKDQVYNNYAICFVWLWNIVSYFEERT
jgi:hypothetical protein